MIAFTPISVAAFGNDQFLCLVAVAVLVFLATSTRRSAKRCPRCREINRPHAVYCAQCGGRLPGK